MHEAKMKLSAGERSNMDVLSVLRSALLEAKSSAPSVMLTGDSDMLSVLRSTFDLRAGFQELEAERMVVVQRIGGVSAQIRSALARAEYLSCDEAVLMLEEKEEQLNRLIILTQQAVNATNISRPSSGRSPADDMAAYQCCAKRLQSLVMELEEGKDVAADALVPKIRAKVSRETQSRQTEGTEEGTEQVCGDISSAERPVPPSVLQEEDARREVTMAFDSTLRLISLVRHFASHALQVLHVALAWTGCRSLN
jgi:hypothetical protein